jgi:hypothetical protein
MKKYSIKCGFLIFSMFVAGCADVTQSLPPTGSGGVVRPASIERQILPSETDSAINIQFEPHVVINPFAERAPRNKLFVFFPGTNALPSDYRRILALGAAKGFHAIGLSYPNTVTLESLCVNNVDRTCFENVRKEIITGVNSSDLVEVSAANSIVNRLEKTLVYMAREYPNEAWGQYLLKGHVNWAKVRIAGHSQGGGHVGMLTKMYKMDRATYFASPADWSYVYAGPSTWVSQKSLTPSSKQYAFIHMQDPVIPYVQFSSFVQAMGLNAFGLPVSVDGSASPYANTHILTTNADPVQSEVVPRPQHAITVIDAATPVNADGSGVFRSAWTYLSFQ